MYLILQVNEYMSIVYSWATRYIQDLILQANQWINYQHGLQIAMHNSQKRCAFKL